MGGVIVRGHVHDAFMQGPEHMAELFHGYTYSAHPLACAAALATLDLYRDEALFERARGLEPAFAAALHALRDARHVVDIRTLGLAGAIELAPREGAPGKRGFEAAERAFFEHDLMVRQAGDAIVLTPPLIVEEAQIADIADRVRAVIDSIE